MDSFGFENPEFPRSGSSDARPARQILTVGQLNSAVAEVLQAGFPLVWVAGEISNFSRPASGHWYFTMKDASASVRAVMFRSASRLVRFNPRDGDRIEVLARVCLYEARGDLQLAVEQMREAGAGDLYQRFLRLKAALQAEGLFDSTRKPPLPDAPRTIGIISSPQAAALQDVLTTLRRRAPQLGVIIYPAAVQGVGAVTELIRALDAANRRAECEVLLLVRGGGSIEDLNAFNDERLARVIAGSRLPVVSGVGHETDFTISDFVATARAPTPTAAAVLVCREREESLEHLRRFWYRLRRVLQLALERGEQRLDLASRLLRSPSVQLHERLARVARVAARLNQAIQKNLHRGESRLLLARRWVRPPSLALPAQRLAGLRDALVRAHRSQLEEATRTAQARAGSLALANPKAILERGYAIVRDAGGKVVRNPLQVTAGERLDVEVAEGAMTVRVESGASGDAA
ncbi:MAG: exodeoxyribonuclease VII large subunit [Lautropia sp.]|nr:exodeoxyribonuclease VII large subunit [Lautropia sp.]